MFEEYWVVISVGTQEMRGKSFAMVADLVRCRAETAAASILDLLTHDGVILPAEIPAGE